MSSSFRLDWVPMKWGWPGSALQWAVMPKLPAVLGCFHAVWTAIAVVVVTAAAGDAVAQPSSDPAPASTTLEDYAARNDIGKPAGAQFVSLRCASLYLFSADMLKDEQPDVAARFRESAKVLIATALRVAMYQAEFVSDQLPRMMAMYSDRAQAAKAAARSVFDDPFLSSDAAFCKRITG